jgi:hypothetical protein
MVFQRQDKRNGARTRGHAKDLHAAAAQFLDHDCGVKVG